MSCMSDEVKVKVTAYEGIFLVIDASNAGAKSEEWYPSGDGRIGCVLLDTKKNLGVSEEALALLRTIRRSDDAIGDVDWFATDVPGKGPAHAFGWLGGPRKIVDPTIVTGSRHYHVPADAFVLIPNDVPRDAVTAIRA